MLALALACAVEIPTAVVPADGGATEPFLTSNGTPGRWSAIQIAVGDGLACGLDAGGLATCWFVVPPMPGAVGTCADDLAGWRDEGVRAKKIAAWGETVCVVDTSGDVRCSSGSEHFEDAPEGTFVDLALAYGEACALGASGSITCWGTRSQALLAPHGGPYIDVSAAGFAACGLGATGRVDCWGETSGFDLATMAGPFSAIDGDCGRQTDGTVRCWKGEKAPLQSGQFRSFSAGNGACGISAEGSVECSDDEWLAAAPEGDGYLAAAVSGHAKTACWLRGDGGVDCWSDGTTGSWYHPDWKAATH